MAACLTQSHWLFDLLASAKICRSTSAVHGFVDRAKFRERLEAPSAGRSLEKTEAFSRRAQTPPGSSADRAESSICSAGHRAPAFTSINRPAGRELRAIVPPFLHEHPIFSLH